MIFQAVAHWLLVRIHRPIVLVDWSDLIADRHWQVLRAFVTNFLLQLDPSTEEPIIILRGDPIGLVFPVLLPKHVASEELKRSPESPNS